MVRFVRYFLFIALFGTAFSLKATHVRAGEITYKWLSGYTYSITLTTYTDDGPSIADRCELTIHFGDGDSCVAQRQNGSASVMCPSGYNGTVVFPGFKKNVYSCVHVYSGTGSYKIYMFDRNRNSGVINIPNSVNQPFYIESLLVINAKPNNSNQLTVLPLYEAALNKCFYHNPGAYDIDGDSLSYELTACKGEGAPGNIGVAIPGYSYPSPGAAGSFRIDSITGTLSWCKPQMNGEYNIAFIIKEWRKLSCSGTYFLVGYVERDMQVVVQNSSNNPPSFSMFKDTCVAAGNLLNMNINTSDLDNNSITISAYGAPFNCVSPFANFTSASSINATGNFSWSASCSNIRKQSFPLTLKATDNGIPGLSNFMIVNVTVIAPAPQNLSVTPGLNIMQLSWNKPVCHPTTGNKISGYSIYRKVGSSSWVHSSCERGVPASSGFTFIGSTPTENDTTAVDYSVISLPNNSTCSYVVYAVYNDCSESYASAPIANQLTIGINEKQKNNYSVSVFPNPGSGIFNLELSTMVSGYYAVTLMDVNGRALNNMLPTFVKDKAEVQLDFNSIENGYYILKIESEDKNCVFKPLIKID